MRRMQRIVSAVLFVLLPTVSLIAQRAVSLEAEDAVKQTGSVGKDTKRAASGGEVLGLEFGSRAGHFAEYAIEFDKDVVPARLAVRYARNLPGYGDLEVLIDGERVGILRYEPTGGWGELRKDFRWASLDVPKIAAGKHKLRLVVLQPRTSDEFRPVEIAPSLVLDRAGKRSDKNSVGHGRNVAVYTGLPSRFFFATHELGNVFSAVDGGTLLWYPDQVVVSPEAGGGSQPNLNLDRIIISKSPGETDEDREKASRRADVIEQRQVCVTDKDVIVSQIHLFNPGDEARVHRIEVTGDCRESRNWRGKPGGDKQSRKLGNLMSIIDKNVFPKILDGLAIVVGANRAPREATTTAAGTYFLAYEIQVPPKSSETITIACAIDPDEDQAKRNLVECLQLKNPVAENRKNWERFYREQVPQFSCSDDGLEELYAFRWFLLRFSTAGGDLGHFRDPVVLEGRQAYQTFCSFSAPFMAFDLNWARDPKLSFGHMRSLVAASYEDGRFPWYTAPNTNRVPIHHRSGTGLSLLQLAAWKHWEVHGDSDLSAKIYDGLALNMEWWRRDRDVDGDGVFVIDHQLETGMDDLLRWPDPRLRYGAVDATSYAAANFAALASLAKALGRTSEATRMAAASKRSLRALREQLWDKSSTSWRDRHPETKKLSDLLAITTFYPFFATANRAAPSDGMKEHLSVFTDHLLNAAEFWLPHPVPALARSQTSFNLRGFWRGPSWPAATSHVIEAFASAAKRHDRSLLPQAAELFRRATKNHLQPRADFFERYQPETGEPLSSFRDYMHSWWIDLFVRHVVGFEPDGSQRAVIDPLPLGLSHFVLRGIPFHGSLIDVAYEKTKRQGSEFARGLTVRVDGETVKVLPDFTPGDAAVPISIE